VLKAITEQIGKDPKNAKLYMDRGDALRKMKLDSLAYKDYVHAVKLDSANASYYSKIGEYLFESKDLNGSIQWFQKALTLDPKDLKSRLKIGKALLYFQKYQEGLNELNLVLRADVYNPEAYFLKGMIYKESKDTAKAISSFQTALQVKPDYKDAIIQLGMIYSARKDSIALRYLENAWTVDSSDVFPLFARGVFYQDNKDYARAKEEYRRCVLRDRHYVDAYFNLGYILMQEDSVVKSYRQYDIVTQIDPRNPTAYFDRAVCLEAMDSIKAAIADYRHALILDPNYPSPKAALKRLKVPLPASQK
jgi:tetratricopeptide (TPR) repeat protein